MTDLPQHLRSVAVNVDAVWGTLFLELAAQMKKGFGTKVHVYVRSPEELRSYRSLNRDGRWDSVTQVDVLGRALQDKLPDEASIVARARDHERRLGDTISTFTFNHRQFGRGYSLGSFYYPRAPGFDKIGYVRMLHAYNELLSFWRGEVESKDVTLILHGDKEQAATARAHGIAFRRLDVSRYRNYWYWTPNEFFFNPAVEAAYNNLNDWPDEVPLHGAYGMAAAKNQIFFDRATLFKVLRNSASGAVRHTAWRLLGRQKAKSYRFFDFVTFGLREHAAYRRMTGREVRSLAQMAGKRFVYFPLHKEPEFSLQLMSPEYFNQHAAIVSVSRDLPAGIMLAVKENLWSLGRRPANFYSQIADLKNVVFLDVREPGVDVIRNCEAVVSVTGTAGFEAAALGKPVITFGRHNMYSLLDHCMTVTDEAQLRGFIERGLEGIDREKARRDGARFFHAVIKSSFDMGDWAVIGEGRAKYRNFGAVEVERAYQALLESFALPNVNQVSTLVGRAA